MNRPVLPDSLLVLLELSELPDVGIRLILGPVVGGVASS